MITQYMFIDSIVQVYYTATVVIMIGDDMDLNAHSNCNIHVH